MDLPERPALPGWEDLPFWTEHWPALRARLAAETGPVYPAAALVFRALDQPPDRIRAIILGQDPYHTPGKADGLAFSIPEGATRRLGSLGNILKEVGRDTGTPRRRTDLSDWAAQGVLLLNTALTVPEGRANGHAGLGWRHLVEDVLRRLDDRPRAAILWGAPAQGYRALLTRPDHLVLASNHPSPLVRNSDFPGSPPFSAVNDWLAARGEPGIDWAGAEAG